MTAAKTNERPGTRAQARYVRTSAYKAREVLDLIRNRSYAEASEILTYSERAISRVIQKCLDSAVANAEHNDGLEAEELYVAACYADEGPTLKRWRPRARGRATRIRKRTCHITVIVARYSPEQLAEMRARDTAKGSRTRAGAADARRRRVAASRERAAERAADDDQHDHDQVEADEVVDDTNVEAAVDESVVDDSVVDEEVVDEADADTAVSDTAVSDEAGTDEADEPTDAGEKE